MNSTNTADQTLRILITEEQPIALFAVLIAVALYGFVANHDAKRIIRRSSLLEVIVLVSIWCVGIAYYVSIEQAPGFVVRRYLAIVLVLLLPSS